MGHHPAKKHPIPVKWRSTQFPSLPRTHQGQALNRPMGLDIGRFGAVRSRRAHAPWCARVAELTSKAKKGTQSALVLAQVVTYAQLVDE